MATKTAQKSAPQAAANTRTAKARKPVTLELVATLAPIGAQAANISRTFGLEPVDFDDIRETTEEQVALSAKTLQTTLNETALRIHLQRLVGAFVSSAHGAGTFYSSKITAARELTMKLANEDRDEDRDGVMGFDTKAARAREFAAQSGLTAFALYAAASGAVHAYAEITGEDWKPYETNAAPVRSVTRQAASAELDAFA